MACTGTNVTICTRPSDYVPLIMSLNWLAWPVQNVNPAMQELCKYVMLATLV